MWTSSRGCKLGQQQSGNDNTDMQNREKSFASPVDNLLGCPARETTLGTRDMTTL